MAPLSVAPSVIDDEVLNREEWRVAGDEVQEQHVKPSLKASDLLGDNDFAGSPKRHQPYAGRGKKTGQRGGALGRKPYRDEKSKSAAELAWDAGEPETDHFMFPMKWSRLLDSLVRSNRFRDGNPGNVCREIGRQSGAFLREPLANENFLYMWGGATETAAAKNLLTELVSSLSVEARPPQKLKDVYFAKSESHNPWKADKAAKKIREEERLNERRKPNDFSPLPSAGTFLWTSHQVPLTRAENQLGTLLDLTRTKTDCHIWFNSDESQILVEGWSDENVRHAMREIQLFSTHMVENITSSIKLYLINPRAPRPMQANVDLVKIFIGPSQVSVPILCGEPVDASVARYWNRSQRVDRNGNKMRDAVESALKTCRFLTGHVRMRILIGRFVLDEYRKPAKGQEFHDLQEFEKMISHERTKGRIAPSSDPSRGERLLQLVHKEDVLFLPVDAQATQLQETIPNYAVTFDFAGSGGTDASRMQFEAQFDHSRWSGNYDLKEKRFIKPSADGQNVLQVDILDFQFHDWEIEVKTLEFPNISAAQTAMKAFAHAVKLEDDGSAKDFLAPPRRLVQFSSDVPVTRIVEKKLMTYRVGMSDYFLEIARHDEYIRIPGHFDELGVPSAHAFPRVPNTTWHVSMYSPEWDNKFGTQASGAFANPSWNPSLNSFFPPSRPSDNPSAGFKEFLEKVMEICVLLGVKIDPPRPVTSESPEKDAKAEGKGKAKATDEDADIELNEVAKSLEDL